jgi:uncharacterized protein (TIRG00374 family)
VTSAPTSEQISQRRRLLRGLRIAGAVVAVGVLALVIDRIGAAAIAHQLLATGPGFLWILVLHGLAISISGLPWHVLLPRSARPTVGQSIISRFVAAGASAVTPVVALAGDLVRLFWLPRRADRAQGVAAIVVDRLTYGAANAVFVVAGALALVHVAGLPHGVMRMTIAGVIALVVLVVAGVLLVGRFRIVGRAHHLIARLLRKERDHQFGDDVDAGIRHMLREQPGALALAFGFNMLYRIAISAEIVVAFHLLGVDLAWDQALVFSALPIVVALAAFLVPSQIGVQEGVQALLAASFGVPETVAVAVVLLLRIRSLIGAVFVAVLIATKKSTLDEVRAVANGNVPTMTG